MYSKCIYQLGDSYWKYILSFLGRGKPISELTSRALSIVRGRDEKQS